MSISPYVFIWIQKQIFLYLRDTVHDTHRLKISTKYTHGFVKLVED